jgi:hypothetical protein
MHDMRELLEIGKGEAPPPPYDVDDLVAAGGRRRRRLMAQRIGGVGVVAVGVATFGLLAVNGIVFSGSPTSRPITAQQRPSAPAAVVVPPLTFMFGPYSVGTHRVLVPQEVTTTYQSATIAADYTDASGVKAAAYVGTLTVYRPGVRPPSVFTSGTKVMVNGQPGYANERLQDPVSIVNGSGAYAIQVRATANTLAWQYTANGWAVINSTIQIASDLSHRLTAADEMALAKAFRLGTPTRARIPFTVGHVPSGWTVASVTGRSFTAEELATVTVILAPSASAPDKIRHFADASDGQAAVITLLHQQATRPPDAPKTKKTCNHLESDTDLYCSWGIPYTTYAIVLHDPTSRLSGAELTAIGEGLTFDNFDRPDTWHPVP